MTESRSFLYGLKDLFTLHKLTDKDLAVKTDDVTSSRRDVGGLGRMGREFLTILTTTRGQQSWLQPTVWCDTHYFKIFRRHFKKGNDCKQSNHPWHHERQKSNRFNNERGSLILAHFFAATEGQHWRETSWCDFLADATTQLRIFLSHYELELGP